MFIELNMVTYPQCLIVLDFHAVTKYPRKATLRIDLFWPMVFRNLTPWLAGTIPLRPTAQQKHHSRRIAGQGWLLWPGGRDSRGWSYAGGLPSSFFLLGRLPGYWMILSVFMMGVPLWLLPHRPTTNENTPKDTLKSGEVESLAANQFNFLSTHFLVGLPSSACACIRIYVSRVWYLNLIYPRIPRGMA